MAKIVWSAPALLQLEAIVEFIALDKPEAAKAVASRIIHTTDHLAQFLLLGRPIKEFARENYRQVWIKPCWLYYRIENADVYILHVRRAEKPLRVEDLIADDR
jgi:plasmid stabilization system protein ParE